MKDLLREDSGDGAMREWSEIVSVIESSLGSGENTGREAP